MEKGRESKPAPLFIGVEDTHLFNQVVYPNGNLNKPADRVRDWFAGQDNINWDFGDT